MGLTTAGAIHDYFLLKEELIWYENNDTWFECVELFVDLGYLGMATDFVIQILLFKNCKYPLKNLENLRITLTLN